MASVDGWKRRQPNKPVHQTLSNGLNAAAAAAAASAVANATNDVSSRASYGATLARGQIPRPHCVLDDSSASSSVSEDTSLQVRVSLFIRSSVSVGVLKRRNSDVCRTFLDLTRRSAG